MKDINAPRPLVSVIVPVYNVEEFLGECIDSILFQTYKDIEIILVDDGSTDSSSRVCDEYAVNHENIFVVHQDNHGLSVARNVGLEVSRGEFITFVDSDDWLDETMIEKCVNLMVEKKASACGVAFMKAYSDGKMTPAESTVKEIAVYPSETALSLYLYNTNLTVCVCGKVWKREVWEGITCPPGLLHEDQYTTHRLLEACKSVVFDPSPLYYYRQRKGSIGHSAFDERSYDLLRGIDQQYNTITQNHPALKNEVGSACSFWYCVFANMMIRDGHQDTDTYERCRQFVRSNIHSVLRTPWYTRTRKLQLTIFALSGKLYEIAYEVFLKRNRGC